MHMAFVLMMMFKLRYSYTDRKFSRAVPDGHQSKTSYDGSVHQWSICVLDLKHIFIKG